MPEMEPSKEQLDYEENIVKMNVKRDQEEKDLIDKRSEYGGKIRKED